MKSSDIVAYTFNADIYCPRCIAATWSGIFDSKRSAEEVLDELAREVGINRHDESSFDGDDFPKVVFLGILGEDSYCGRCSRPLP